MALAITADPPGTAGEVENGEIQPIFLVKLCVQHISGPADPQSSDTFCVFLNV